MALQLVGHMILDSLGAGRLRTTWAEDRHLDDFKDEEVLGHLSTKGGAHHSVS